MPVLEDQGTARFILQEPGGKLTAQQLPQQATLVQLMQLLRLLGMDSDRAPSATLPNAGLSVTWPSARPSAIPSSLPAATALPSQSASPVTANGAVSPIAHLFGGIRSLINAGRSGISNVANVPLPFNLPNFFNAGIEPGLVGAEEAFSGASTVGTSTLGNLLAPLGVLANVGFGALNLAQGNIPAGAGALGGTAAGAGIGFGLGGPPGAILGALIGGGGGGLLGNLLGAGKGGGHTSGSSIAVPDFGEGGGGTVQTHTEGGTQTMLTSMTHGSGAASSFVDALRGIGLDPNEATRARLQAFLERPRGAESPRGMIAAAELAALPPPRPPGPPTFSEMLGIINKAWAPHGEFQVGSGPRDVKPGSVWANPSAPFLGSMGSSSGGFEGPWNTTMARLQDPNVLTSNPQFVKDFISNLWVQGPGVTGVVPFNPQLTAALQQEFRRAAGFA